MITGDLGAIFPKRPASEEGRLQDLMKLVREHSPVGAAVLEEAGDCKLFFNEMYGAAGAYYRGLNAIALNPHCSDAQLFSTLVHEARHASQRYADPKNPDMQTQIQLNRAKEADAMAFECAAAFDARNTYPDAWDTFAVSHLKVVKAYADAALETQDRAACIREAFKAWFDDQSYVNRYDLLQSKYIHSSYIKEEKEFLPSSEILESICRWGSDGGYMSKHSDFLETERIMSVSRDVYGIYEKKNAEGALLYPKIGRDYSLYSFSVISETGKIKPCVFSQKLSSAKEALSFSPTAAALIADFESEGGRIIFASPKRAEQKSTEKPFSVFISADASDNEALKDIVIKIRESGTLGRDLAAGRFLGVGDAVSAHRAFCADKGAVLGAVCYELRRKNPDLWRWFKEENPSQAVAYARSRQRFSDAGMAYEAAFKAFYGDRKAVRRSDECVLQGVGYGAQRQNLNGSLQRFGIGKCNFYVPGSKASFSASGYVSGDEALRMDSDILSKLKKLSRSNSAFGEKMDKSAEAFCTWPEKRSIISSGKKVGAVLAAWFKGDKAR